MYWHKPMQFYGLRCLVRMTKRSIDNVTCHVTFTHRWRRGVQKWPKKGLLIRNRNSWSTAAPWREGQHVATKNETSQSVNQRTKRDDGTERRSECFRAADGNNGAADWQLTDGYRRLINSWLAYSLWLASRSTPHGSSGSIQSWRVHFGCVTV